MFAAERAILTFGGITFGAGILLGIVLGIVGAVTSPRRAAGH